MVHKPKRRWKRKSEHAKQRDESHLSGAKSTEQLYTPQPEQLKLQELWRSCLSINEKQVANICFNMSSPENFQLPVQRQEY